MKITIFAISPCKINDYETFFIYFIDDACYAGYHGGNDDSLQC
jgi:hypothetical protein